MAPARSPYLDEGVRLFEAGDYFLAHETLEEHWVDAPEDERDFLQGLIHLSVGLLHAGRGNSKGALLQFRKASTRLEPYPDVLHGIDLAGVRAFLGAAPAAVERGESLTAPTLDAPDG
jgi:predicted metal-dependent hydrolase